MGDAEDRGADRGASEPPVRTSSRRRVESPRHCDAGSGAPGWRLVPATQETRGDTDRRRLGETHGDSGRHTETRGGEAHRGMIRFVLLVNAQGRVRLSRHYERLGAARRRLVEAAAARAGLRAGDGDQCSFVDYKDYRLVSRRYAALYCIVGIDSEENELEIYELIHNFIETLDKYFNRVCELAIMFNLEKVHMVLDEMVVNGRVAETSQTRILAPIYLMERADQSQ
ncbi:AP-4 complex subunit sigma-1 isoform X2 [Petromyzon marinus]|uniref:AP-4 complex subunit sigma-1 n=1 Tax=Petromyzon marinus TaxID=7757 RepID=A0AAJ7TNL5_PETMA|nr:AP-4 complex subunit sigma-1 isoform X2 [Petromyzon marinus]